MAKEASEHKGILGKKTYRRKDLIEVRFSQMRIAMEEKDGILRKVNFREDFGTPEQIAIWGEGLRRNKVKMPMSGYRKPGEEFVYITEGERRYKGMEYVWLKYGEDLEAWVMLEPQGGLSSKERTINLFHKNMGVDFNELEKAMGIKRLSEEEGMSDTQIAKELDYAGAYVSRLKNLIKAPEELIEVIKNGRISGTTAINEMVKDGAVSFVRDLKAGRYDTKGVAAQEPEELFDGNKNYAPVSEQRVTKKYEDARITSKDIKRSSSGGTPAGVNSVQVLRKFIAKYKGKPEDPVKKKVLIFATKLINNDWTLEQLEKYFK